MLRNVQTKGSKRHQQILAAVGNSNEGVHTLDSTCTSPALARSPAVVAGRAALVTIRRRDTSTPEDAVPATTACRMCRGWAFLQVLDASCIAVGCKGRAEGAQEPDSREAGSLVQVSCGRC